MSNSRYTGYPQLKGSNAHTFSSNEYRQDDPHKNLSVVNESDINYTYNDFYLTVSSKDRDTSAYPNVNRYTIKFPTELRNIYSIELIQGIVPDKNDVMAEPYLLLKIDEVEDIMISVDKHMSDAFAILQLAPPQTSGTFIHIDKRIHENTVKYFRTPKASLSKMTITITDCNGVPFDFGSDSPDPPLKALQNTFVFKVVCVEKNRSVLNHRSVF